jgi:hypothetical protein
MVIYRGQIIEFHVIILTIDKIFRILVKRRIINKAPPPDPCDGDGCPAAVSGMSLNHSPGAAVFYSNCLQRKHPVFSGIL